MIQELIQVAQMMRGRMGTFEFRCYHKNVPVRLARFGSVCSMSLYINDAGQGIEFDPRDAEQHIPHILSEQIP